MAIPIITGLRADIMPQRKWPLRQWFYANSMRYYHRPRLSQLLLLSPRFYELVDPDLRALCRLFHERGLHTTPSCQGHFHSKVYFERLWDEIKHEEAEITTNGLPVEDSETGQHYLFQEPQYRLPWDDFGSFYGQSTLHQPTGYLGILLPFEEQALYERFHSGSEHVGKIEISFDEKIGRQLGGHLYHLFVHPTDPQDGKQQWQRLTDRVREWLVDTGQLL